MAIHTHECDCLPVEGKVQHKIEHKMTEASMKPEVSNATAWNKQHAIARSAGMKEAKRDINDRTVYPA